MAVHLWVGTLALATLLIVERAFHHCRPPAMSLIEQPKATPICEHMAELPNCPQTPYPICGTDGVTYNNECYLCLTRIQTKKDIEIMKDGKC
ncbi:serine protease inhibitor Kazal-type 4 [Ctenodactylus gundi]